MDIIDHPSPNHSARKTGVPVDTVLLHHTGTDKDGHWSDRGALNALCNPKDGVSAHYLVTTGGSILRLVPEELKAWHAGMGRLPWETCPEYDFNHRSIGIEIVNPGDGKTPFTEAQYLALAWLVPDIVRRLSLGTLTMPDSEPRTWRGVTPEVTAAGVLYPGQVLGHRHVAPGRKTDPADNFDWARIREALAPAPRVG